MGGKFYNFDIPLLGVYSTTKQKSLLKLAADPHFHHNVMIRDVCLILSGKNTTIRGRLFDTVGSNFLKLYYLILVLEEMELHRFGVVVDY